MGDDEDAAAAELQHLLSTKFSLTGSEARTLVALSRSGSATARQLAHLTKITQPNLYPILDALTSRGLCRQVPGGVRVWVAHDRDELIALLAAAETERLRSAGDALQQSVAKARQLVSRLPVGAETSASGVRRAETVQVGELYLSSMATVQSEILVWNRGRPVGDPGVPEELAAALARGVQARAVWQLDELQASEANEDRTLFDAYTALGVDQRVADWLPMSLAVLDRTLALVAVPGEGDDLPYRTNLVVHDPALVDTMRLAFDQLWATAKPFADAVSLATPPPDRGNRRRRVRS